MKMKNKEKYAKEIVEIVCEGCALAVSKETGKPVRTSAVRHTRIIQWRMH